MKRNIAWSEICYDHDFDVCWPLPVCMCCCQEIHYVHDYDEQLTLIFQMSCRHDICYGHNQMGSLGCSHDAVETPCSQVLVSSSISAVAFAVKGFFCTASKQQTPNIKFKKKTESPYQAPHYCSRGDWGGMPPQNGQAMWASGKKMKTIEKKGR